MTTTTATKSTSDDVAYQLHQVDRLLARMADLLDDADHPGVHLRAHYKPSIQIVWGTYTEWVRGCDWLSDIGADMTTREVGGGGISDTIILADAKVGHIDVTFSCMKREA
jgi:hypothetical protein